MTEAVILKKPKDLTKEQAQEFFEKLEPNFFQQGSCYKIEKDWHACELDDIVYIAEYGYESKDVEDLYTKEDFINAVKEYKYSEGFAYDLFDMVDWQSPYTLLEELEDVR